MQAQDGTQFFKDWNATRFDLKIRTNWSYYKGYKHIYYILDAQSHDTILNGLWYDILYASVFEKKPTTLCPKLRLSLKIRSTVNCSLNTQLDFKQPSANILPYLISQCLNVPNREKGIEMLTRPRCSGEFMYARFVHLKSLWQVCQIKSEPMINCLKRAIHFLN